MPTPYGGQSQQRWGDNTVSQNEYMRDVQMTDLSGKVCATGDARRKGMLVFTFFRADDPLSKELLPLLQKLADAYKESGKLTVWGVSESAEDAARAFASDNSVTFPILLDHDQYHAMVYGLTRFPTLFFTDGGGTVLRRAAGKAAIDALDDISIKVAAFAQVDPVSISGAALPVPPKPEPEPAAAAAA